ncbi:MAG: ABC transporter permease [Caulobacteraceae bacterium]|nr:ABC transporter permease [Caulobacteraceae bacterium]
MIAGAVLVGAVVVMAALSLVWTPYDPGMMGAAARLAAPSPAHPFGADAYGRDLLSMIMAGSRSALAVALAACALGLGVGAPLGLLAAARGGWVDELVMRGGDLVFAFPALLIAVLLAAALGPGALNAVLAIGVFNAPVFARVTRGAALSLWSQDYILAARLAGKGALRISAEHIAPNLLSGLIVQGAIQLSLAVVADAGLSYVGLGVQPPEPSWGRMLGEAQTLFVQAPWLALFPGCAIVLTVLGFSLLGEGLRARLDPRASGGED